MLAALSGTNGVVAVAAAGAAVVALLACASLALSLRRLRRAQRVVLGDRGSRDMVEHAAELEQAFDELHEHVDTASRHSDGRIASVEAALRGTIAHRALVRYD